MLHEMKVTCVAAYNSGLLGAHKGRQSGENMPSTMRSYVRPTLHATATKEPLRCDASAERESMLHRPEHEHAERESATPWTLLWWNQRTTPVLYHEMHRPVDLSLCMALVWWTQT